MTQRNERGQILLPGLAIFLGLLVLLLAFIAYGKQTLTQMRMEMAAQAAALSAARAEAQILNDAASHNLALDGMVAVDTDIGLGTTQWDLKNPLDLWYAKENPMHSIQAILNGMKIFPVSVGNQVARLNGATKIQHWPLIIDPQLVTHDLEILFFKGIYPVPKLFEYDDIYYMRTWKPDLRRAQPTHMMSWWAGRDGVAAIGSAHVYLDVRKGTSHNGGFPRPHQEIWEGLDVQSLYPQFNGRLVASPVLARLWQQFSGS